MDDPSAPPFEEHRFLVNSAEEAVQMIREKLGEHAQVTSVRRVERAGLSGMFRGPQLEVVARAPAQSGTRPHIGAALPAPTLEHLPVNPWEADEPATASDHVGRTPSPPPAAAAPASGDSRVAGLLRRAGLGDLLVARLQAIPGWARVEKLSLPQALAETVNLLRLEYAAAPRPALGPRLAFLGMAGAGSTSALCKHLARCVFNLGLPAAVYRLETDRPNPIDGLAAVCELWGVPLLRGDDEMPAAGDGIRLYVDVPGLAEGAGSEEGEKIAAALERLRVDTRIFVLNAAYEPALLKGLCRRAEQLGCRHLGFSHLDELVHWGKMWELLLLKDLRPEFYSLGPSVPGEYTEDILEATVGKTFV